jgi:hypothetical protein
VRTYADLRRRMKQARQVAPHLQGASATWQVLRCIDWPIPAANPPKKLDIRGSILLTRTGDGHTSYHSSDCAQAATDAYLVTRKAPSSLVCRG